MLDFAIRYQNELTDLLRQTWMKEKYKFWNATSFFEDFSFESSTWVNHQFVSVRNEKVIGYIAYSITRADGDVVYNLQIINFEDKPSMTFAKDLGQALTDIFEKFRLRKLNFEVIVGNPAEKAYDKMIQRHGGRVVGYWKQQARLFDGKYYDIKLYEIMRENYLAEKEKRGNAKRCNFND